ncbi:PREDICTED: uncharacterized protein LOC106909104 [Poecilia mexicana]|uniref:uncharacterized protein LOC106909104 n=1 Tax=Poecilia mexicana TaxID=48701 RepID=UPI00072E1472|nr:PREDICTED: uncharacterized protein LOC106909104 [Poecilia mexicana]
MLLLKQEALLFIQLVNIWSVSTAEHYDVLVVSRGDSVLFTCSISNENTTLIQWTKGRCFFSYSSSNNRTLSNFSSHALKIDTNIPSTLSIDSAQFDDAGLYFCHITETTGLYSMRWNVTVLENQNAIGSSLDITIIFPFAIGLLLSFMTTALCLCSRRNISGNQNQDSRTLTWVQYNIMDGAKAVSSPFQTTAMWRRTDKQDNVEAVLMTRGTISK